MRRVVTRTGRRLARALLRLCAGRGCGPALLSVLAVAMTGGADAGTLKEVRFRHDGMMREYLVYSPTGRPAARRPLVMVLHGGGGTHRGMIRLTRERWNELADEHGFYVVYPNADARIWDLGDDPVSRARRVRVDDLNFLRVVLARVAREHPVDGFRLFATGISRGGQAAYFLACRWPGVFRAIGAVAMPLPAFLERDCRATEPTGVIVINGTADPLVPYDGGQITVFGRERGRVLSTDLTMALWRAVNRCGETPDRMTEIDRPGDATRVLRTDWTRCAGPPVTLMRVENGGHTWPGGRAYLRRARIGEVSQDIDGVEEIWRFFSRY